MGKWDFLDPYDEEIWRALEDGDLPRAFNALVQGYMRPVMGRCIAQIGNQEEGEDVAMDSFIAIHDALPRFRGDSSIRQWVFSIVGKQCSKHRYKFWNRRRLFGDNHQKIQDSNTPDPQLTPEDLYDEELRRDLHHRDIEWVLMCLKQLDDWSRTLIIMKYYEELSGREIARQLRKLPRKIQRNIKTAEDKLRCLFNEGNEDAHDT